jgi:hypothetical protein
MSEPEYTYVRGQGWIIDCTPAIIEMECGTRVRIEKRPPTTGEYFVADYHLNARDKTIEQYLKDTYYDNLFERRFSPNHPTTTYYTIVAV